MAMIMRPLPLAAFVALTGLVASLVPVRPAGAEEFVIIVNHANPLGRLTRSEVSRLFLRRTKVWPNGVAAVPYDLSGTSPIRAFFSTGVHKKALWVVLAFWQQEIASGRTIPPEVHPTEQAALDAVRENPGAIAYVASGRTLGPGVKALAVEPPSP
jgi:ABC-type phosphate transport system substrate-binding protein